MSVNINLKLLWQLIGSFLIYTTFSKEPAQYYQNDASYNKKDAVSAHVL